MLLAETLPAMKFKLASTISALALALVAVPSESHAKVYTTAQFKAELAKRVGKKTNNAAITQASAFLKLALTDVKNKKNLLNFTNLTVAALKKGTTISSAFQAVAAQKLAQSFTTGYFKKNTYNIKDPKFVQSLKKTLTLVKGTNRTAANAKKIANVYLALVKKKGNKPAEIKFVNDTVYKALGQKPPIS